MSGAELALGALALTGGCVRRGSDLIRMCHSYRHADAEFQERVTRLGICWVKTKEQIRLIEEAAEIFDPKLLEQLCNGLECLHGKLQVAREQLEPADGSMPKRLKAKFAWRKPDLDKLIDDIEAWQRLIDPSWYLALRTQKPEIDTAIGHSTHLQSAKVIRAGVNKDVPASVTIFRSEAELRKARWQKIAYCEAELAHCPGRDQPLIIDTVPSRSSKASVDSLATDVRNLAAQLRQREPHTFGLLSCKCVVKWYNDKPVPTAFKFVFALPGDAGRLPRSLRDILTESPQPVSLTHRLALAKDIAKAVHYVHAFGFVHKNIRPETILAFPREDAGWTAFLVGLQNFRKSEGRTYRCGDKDWEKNLYRHPSRRGLTPSDDYVMQHDIFSLGICLLEIGLWTSFVEYDEEKSRPRQSRILATSEGSASPPDGKSSELDPRMLELARSVLPGKMGSLYAEVTETCLTCLCPDNKDFGDEREFQDEDEIVVGVRYIDKVLSKLGSINI